jgi:hypothetical protein
MHAIPHELQSNSLVINSKPVWPGDSLDFVKVSASINSEDIQSVLTQESNSDHPISSPCGPKRSRSNME